METNVSVAGCPEAAAVELVKVISESERTTHLDEQLSEPRKYYLALYRECLAAVRQA